MGGLTAQALLVPSDPRGGRSCGSRVSWSHGGEVLWSGRQGWPGRPAGTGRAGCRAGEQRRRSVVGPMLGPDRRQLRRLPHPLGRLRDHGCGRPPVVGCRCPGWCGLPDGRRLDRRWCAGPPLSLLDQLLVRRDSAQVERGHVHHAGMGTTHASFGTTTRPAGTTVRAESSGEGFSQRRENRSIYLQTDRQKGRRRKAEARAKAMPEHTPLTDLERASAEHGGGLRTPRPRRLSRPQRRLRTPRRPSWRPCCGGSPGPQA